MKQSLFTICILLTFLCATAQVKKISGTSGKPFIVNMADENTKDFHPHLIHLDQHPIPSAEYGNKKAELDKLRALKKAEMQNIPQQKKTRGSAPNPTVFKGIQGNTSSSVPNDNDIAVSNNGTVVSVVNSNMSVYNDTGKLLVNKRSLTSMTAAVGNYTWISDPRVIYDPNNDRFILVCFSGNLSTESVILVGFSQTNDPAANWNFYTLNGASFNDSTWSDYPIISISDQDLFITFNQVKDNVSWTVGFKQSVIWQIQKYEGFAGTPLVYDLWSNIQYNGGNLRNICPAKYQTATMGSNMYFLTLRNVASTNDSIFVTEITNSKASGMAQLTTRVLTSPTAYGFPPNVPQKLGQYLMTNDARVLAAIYENDYIHFGSNTVNPQFMNAGVYLGTIKNISSATPTVKADIISTATQEFGYPSMTYVGSTNNDHKVLYNMSHCYTDSFPGASVMYKNTNEDYSDIISVKDGLSIVNRLTDTVERWGDYTNIQHLYNNPNRAYLSNSWGKSGANNCWISIVDHTDFPLSTNEMINNSNSIVFPNPISENRFTTTFNLTAAQKLRYEIVDMQGKLVAIILDTKTKTGKNEFSFTTDDLAKGNYIFRIVGEKEMIATHKITIE